MQKLNIPVPRMFSTKVDTTEKEKYKMSDINTLKLKVVGRQTLHCAGCERTAEFTLSNLPSVKAVKADHKAQTIQLSMISGETDLEDVSSKLEGIGYQVELA